MFWAVCEISCVSLWAGAMVQDCSILLGCSHRRHGEYKTFLSCPCRRCEQSIRVRRRKMRGRRAKPSRPWAHTAWGPQPGAPRHNKQIRRSFSKFPSRYFGFMGINQRPACRYFGLTGICNGRRSQFFGSGGESSCPHCDGRPGSSRSKTTSVGINVDKMYTRSQRYVGQCWWSMQCIRIAILKIIRSLRWRTDSQWTEVFKAGVVWTLQS